MLCCNVQYKHIFTLLKYELDFVSIHCIAKILTVLFTVQTKWNYIFVPISSRVDLVTVWTNSLNLFYLCRTWTLTTPELSAGKRKRWLLPRWRWRAFDRPSSTQMVSSPSVFFTIIYSVSERVWTKVLWCHIYNISCLFVLDNAFTYPQISLIVLQGQILSLNRVESKSYGVKCNNFVQQKE